MKKIAYAAALCAACMLAAPAAALDTEDIGVANTEEILPTPADNIQTAAIDFAGDYDMLQNDGALLGHDYGPTVVISYVTIDDTGGVLLPVGNVDMLVFDISTGLAGGHGSAPIARGIAGHAYVT